MVTVVVERTFSTPKGLAELQGQEASATTRSGDIRLLRSYISEDQTRLVSVYEAPSADDVQAAQDQAGLPYDKIYGATVL